MISGITDAGLASIGLRCAELTTLHLNGCAVCGDGLVHIAAGCPSLERLSLVRCLLQDDALAAMQPGSMRTLRSLDLAEQNTFLGPTQLQRLISVTPTGRRLTLVGYSKIFAACPRVQYLRVSANERGILGTVSTLLGDLKELIRTDDDREEAIVVDADVLNLANGCSGLESLDLSDLRLAVWQVDAPLHCGMATLIETCTALRCLRLDYVVVGVSSAAHMDLIALALCSLPVLETLGIQMSDVTDVGLAHLITAPSLLHLGVDYCERITIAGVCRLVCLCTTISSSPA